MVCVCAAFFLQYVLLVFFIEILFYIFYCSHRRASSIRPSIPIQLFDTSPNPTELKQVFCYAFLLKLDSGMAVITHCIGQRILKSNKQLLGNSPGRLGPSKLDHPTFEYTGVYQEDKYTAE